MQIKNSLNAVTLPTRLFNLVPGKVPFCLKYYAMQRYFLEKALYQLFDIS